MENERCGPIVETIFDIIKKVNEIEEMVKRIEEKLNKKPNCPFVNGECYGQDPEVYEYCIHKNDEYICPFLKDPKEKAEPEKQEETPFKGLKIGGWVRVIDQRDDQIGCIRRLYVDSFTGSETAIVAWNEFYMCEQAHALERLMKYEDSD